MFIYEYLSFVIVVDVLANTVFILLKQKIIIKEKKTIPKNQNKTKSIQLKVEIPNSVNFKKFEDELF